MGLVAIAISKITISNLTCHQNWMIARRIMWVKLVLFGDHQADDEWGTHELASALDPESPNALNMPGDNNEAVLAGEDDEVLEKLVGEEDVEANDADAAGSAEDGESSSTIHLSNVMALKEVDTILALVCLTRAEKFRKKSLIN
mmetsp:Transcript_7709/g.16763  ORF Transcript_7709/g.16763 Transcript_7709/m.16763 type:complete len:144 (-) Transcript_7709:87-518(-)